MSTVRLYFFFSSRRRHTRYWRDWSSDVCSSDLERRRVPPEPIVVEAELVAVEVGRGHHVVDKKIRRDVPAGRSRVHLDRKSVVEGKRGDLGGRRFIKKKKKK